MSILDTNVTVVTLSQYLVGGIVPLSELSEW